MYFMNSAMATFFDIAVLCFGKYVGGHFYNSTALVYNVQLLFSSNIVCFKHEVFAEMLLEHLSSCRVQLV